MISIILHYEHLAPYLSIHMQQYEYDMDMNI